MKDKRRIGRIRAQWLLAAAVTVTIGLASPAQATHWNLIWRLCPEEIVRVPDLVSEVPVPVGCEVVDCCPGCPGPGPIDWLIRVAGKDVAGVEVRFDGLEPGAASRLRVDGDAKWTEDGVLRVGPEGATLRGLPFAGRGRPPVAFPRIETAGGTIFAAGQANQDQPRGEAPDEGDASEVTIVQAIGGFAVNSFRAGWVAVPCVGGGGGATDRIRLTNNAGGDSAVALSDGRRTGCANDDIYRVTTSRDIVNLRSPGSCNVEAAVFSDDNAMALVDPVTVWTNPPGDELSVPLQPRIAVPVSVWLATPGVLARAVADIANANLLYNQNNVGVRFVATYQNVSGNPAAVATIGGGCASAGAVQASAFFTANRLNAYYVGGAFTAVNCGANRNIQYVGTTANIASLAHEFGHAYSLRPSGSGGHTNGLAGFGNNNIMWGGGPATRNNFSVGQAFRINVDDSSMLNVNGDRTDPVRDCPPLTTNARCPALALDSLPH